MEYPLDLLRGDTDDLIQRASKSDAEILDWRKRMIGRPFRPDIFVGKIEQHLEQRRRRLIRAKSNPRERAEKRQLQTSAILQTSAVEPEVDSDKILLYCPLYPGEPRIHPRTLESIFAIRWPGQLDIVLGRNDSDSPEGLQEKHKLITQKYNQARLLALHGNYQALFTVEADMVIPPDALEKLIAVEADVAYGLYLSRHSLKWYLHLPKGDGHIKASNSEKLRREVWGKVVHSAGLGMGCTLIKRNVLEKISFRMEESAANDFYLAQDCRRHNFSQMHDCSLLCGHIDEDEILWPDPTKVVRREKL